MLCPGGKTSRHAGNIDTACFKFACPSHSDSYWYHCSPCADINDSPGHLQSSDHTQS